jgi:miniconductance mechanosensitive channel
MGFIAGVQLAANKMIAIGDWIEVPQFGANGAVKVILMSTVKVQNWDNTITTVPARALISDSFKNWRPMALSGGRRLQRSVRIDVHSLRVLSPELLACYPALADTWQQIQSQRLPEGDVLVADARQEPTNLGIYRAYLSAYLRRHPRVNQEMVKMVRQLQPDENGLPLELTAYLADTDWAPFETASSSIFEHVFATLPQFGLRVFQRQVSVETVAPEPQKAAQP